MSLHHLKTCILDARGSVAVMFGVVLLAVALVAGAAVDYGRAVSVRTALQSSLDVAALAGAKLRGEGVKDEATIAAAATAALKRHFEREAPGAALEQIEVKLAASGLGVSVSAKAQLPTTFMAITAIDTVTMANSATATLNEREYLDFHFLLDTSDSMGLAADDDARKKLMLATKSAKSQANCEFACHVKEPHESTTRLELARKLGVRLRMDVATDGVLSFGALAKAAESQNVTSRFSISAFSSQVFKVADFTEDLGEIEADIQQIEIGHGMGTSFANTWYDKSGPDYLTLLKTFKKPVKTSTQTPYIVLVTDGLQSQYGGTLVKKTIRTFDLDVCKSFKAAGYQVAVVYTKYYPIPSNAWYNNNVAPIYDDIESNLRACASGPDLFAVGDTPGEIDAAFKKIFNAARSKLRLTS